MTPLGKWLKDQGLSLAEFGRQIGETAEQVRRYCLPVEHPTQRIPNRHAMARIFLRTGGAVRPDHFYPLPELPAKSEQAEQAA